ncbi:RimK family alpha-L-glutamate ligase [Streptomyces sp. NPDC005576]|uniref:ATP-grasp domain-containing protein n=1 Tax=Streptomyces sp. NPDC005576 TaxID=3364726 RepID=UPI0036C3F815
MPDATVPPRIACVTSTRLPELCEDDQPFLDELRLRGARAEPVVWDDPEAPWAEYDGVVVRSPWDYPDRPAEFLRWYDRVASVTRIHNSPAAVRGNQHKGYLADLWKADAPVIPTVVVDDPSEAVAVARAHKWDQAVLKPATGLGGRRVTLLTASGDGPPPVPHGPDGAQWCVQPFLPRIREEGELSLVYIDGRPSHAVLKQPSGRDIRVHEGHGGRHMPMEPTAELVDAGDAVLAATGTRDELFARVDVIRDHRGRLLLCELDVTSPCLYFCHRPQAAGDLAAATVARATVRAGATAG